MKAVITAILTDYEARSPALISEPGYGHLREPMIRIAQLLRSGGATTGAGSGSAASGSTGYSASMGDVGMSDFAAEAQGVAPSFHDREAQRICWPSDLRS